MWVTNQKMEKEARTVSDPLTKVVRGPQTLYGRHAMFLLCNLIKPPEGILDIGSSYNFLQELFYVILSQSRETVHQLNNDQLT